MLSCSVMPNSLQPRGLYPTRLLCPWDFSGKNAGVGCHFLLQGIFPNQGSNLHLLHWQVDSLLLSRLRSPSKVEGQSQREGIFVHVWLIHFAVQQVLIQQQLYYNKA